MYRLIINIICLFFTCSLFASSPAHTSIIDVQKGEKWWGIFVSGSIPQPFSEPFRTETSDVSLTASLKRPVLLSNNGRIIRSSEPMTVEFTGDSFKIESHYEKVSAEKVGKTLRDAYLVCCHRYFPPNGNTPAPTLFTAPVYDLGYKLGQGQGQGEVLEYASELLKNGFPAGTLILPIGWSSMNGGFYPDQELYPDMGSMIDLLHDMGFKVAITISPYLPMAGRNYMSARKEGLLLEVADKPVTDRNGLPLGVYNLGKAETLAVFKNGLDRISSSMHFDGYVFDSGIYLPADAEFIGSWTSLNVSLPNYGSIGTPLEGFSSELGGIRIEKSSTEAIINDLIVAGMLGYPYTRTYWVATGTLTDQEIYRHICLQAGLPVAMIEHSPWELSDPILKSGLKEILNYRAKMAGYMQELLVASSKTAEPLIRHMEYQFPKSGFSDCRDQFMLGAKYMFAPPTDSAKRLVRIPKGIWYDGHGKRYRGPIVIEINCNDALAGCYEHADK